ncbi:hypothetical protein C7S18_07945 [Ahniella affigens]|uniref:Acyltransferase 3 domain-containing protein n=1 Tax=Ahniella affigens TaxID=2021234 RepID=A0A2P1PQK0_9GAMM|nr:acyltransferase family protein [Ahniella affigens]AVP97127.1 hypothetical protein C7S18_07945 [Ahniella affigens]
MINTEKVAVAPGRRRDLEQLRALAMLTGVVFHAGLAYSAWAHPFMPTADRQHSVWVDVLLWLPHLCRMPVFFVIAGFAAATLIARQGTGALIRNRSLRILLPCLVLVPVNHLTMQWLLAEAMTRVVHRPPLLDWLGTHSEASAMLAMPGTGHLWFLYYLLILTVLTWSVRQFNWSWLTRLSWLRRESFWQWGLPCLLIPALASVSAPHPAPESLLPNFWALTFFGAFYVLGFWMATSNPIRVAIESRSIRSFLLIIPAYAAFLLLVQERIDWLGTQDWTEPMSLSRDWRIWPIAALEAYLSVWTSVCLLNAAARWLSRPSFILSYLSEASYWTYVVHLPILFAIQYRLLDLEWPAVGKFALAVALTLSFSLVSYAVLVRHTPLARIFGVVKRSDDRGVALAASRTTSIPQKT